MKQVTESIRFFGRYFRRFKLPLTILFIFTILATYFQVKISVYIGKAITDLADFAGRYANPITSSTASLDQFNRSLLVLVALIILMTVAILIATIVQAVMSPYIINDMRRGLFGKIQRMTIKYFDSHRDGEILSRFTSDLDNISNAMNQAIFQTFTQFCMLIGIVIMMFNQNTRMASVTIMSTPIAIILAVIIIIQARKNINKQQDEIGHINAYINEQINGQKLIITNGLQQESIAGFVKHNRKVRQSTYKGQVWAGILMPLMQGLSLVNMAIVIFYGGHLALDGTIDRAVGLGLIVIFVNFSNQYYQSIAQITSMYNQLQLAATGANRLQDIFDQAEEQTPKNPKEFKQLTKAIELDRVRFGYNPDREILRSINIDLNKGQMVALVGPTGSGKTTVMNLLNRFYDVTDGAVTFDGINIKDIDLKNLRNQVGIVLQESVLFTGTIADNIKFGKPTANDQEMIEAAKQANIHDFIAELPDGYQTRVDDENSVFSVGQKQLIAIARTILTDPQLLILDEATSNVDTVTEAKIQKAMDNVIQNRTSFVIAHRLKTILNADKIVVLRDGQVIEQGTHQQLLAEDGFYAELYKNQMVFD